MPEQVQRTVQCTVRTDSGDMTDVVNLASAFASFVRIGDSDDSNSSVFIFSNYRDLKFFAFRAESLDVVIECTDIPIYSPQRHGQ